MAAMLAWWETTFRSTGEFPSIGTTLAYFPKSKAYLQSQDFLQQLKNRGLPYNEILTPDGYPVGFINAANLLLDISDRRTKAAKLKFLGITTREWNGWLQLQKCYDYFSKEADKTFTRITPVDVKHGLSRAVEQGDLNAIKYYNELVGIYRPGEATLLNLSQVMAQMMEILVRYVKPEQLAQLANELEQVIETSGRELEAARD